MSQKVASAALVDALDGSGLYTEPRNLALWQQVPAELRLTEFSPCTLPDHPAFRWRLGCRPEWRGFDLGPLPEPMQRDFAYCLWRVIDSGLTITAPYARLVNWLIRLAEDLRLAGRPPLRSLIDRPASDWEHELVKERARRNGKLGWPHWGAGIFRRCYRHLLIAYDPREWWQHDAWSPRFDARIPLRDHEPAVARAGYDFTVIEQRWLRAALKWQLKTALETGLLRWASVLARLRSLTIFSQFIAQRGIDEPRLCADRGELRLLALDFLAHIKQRRARCGANRGELVTNGTVRHTINHVERFYAFMADYKHEAVRALGEPRWEALGDEHARLWRPGEKPLLPRLPDDDVYFDDHTMAQVMRHAGLLGAPPEEGGIGDEQAMRILMLLARTGRRAGELLLLDFDCLLPIAGIPADEQDRSPDAIVARLRFQQTKIEGAPNTIFVDGEVVAIVRAQQQWVHDHVRALLRDPAARPPRYLFLAITRNNQGRHSYPKTTVTRRLQQLGELADIRDSQGRRPPLSHVHRFRHTRATSLINAGVPVHVVQRYLGHLSAEMTMRYAHTLRETHEREFLRYKKITADGNDLALDPRDLFGLIELGKRTDRVLPNGLCMLPPRQTCNRGNACLTCDKFTTDASYLPEHEQQLEKLNDLIAQRQAAFRARTGEEMTRSNVWLEQRLTEQRALEKIITVLNQPELTEHPDQAVRGPATSARVANQPATDQS
ncbi:MAG TPA: tyrosine-type recombinase/integrase [Solirubrobacteraceae bacterium]|nr:tyrosine-type recombinase/integrase [Solirubrobacteraceae bacterium]